jgi:ribosomal-protein-alanine N-acetyltransferase
MLKIEKGLNKQWFYWAISSKNSPGLIGTICLWNFNEENKSAEVGYELLPIFQGKGLMQEALSNVIVFGFKTAKFKRIIAYTHSRNDKSIKLLQKAGFIRDLSLEKELHQNNKHSDDIVFSLKRVTFLQKLRG